MKAFTIQFLLASAVILLCITLSAVSCRERSRSKSADATRILLEFGRMADSFSQYAIEHEGALPQSLHEIGLGDTVGAIQLSYVGHGRWGSASTSSRTLVVFADPEHFREIGVPVLWSDGEADVVAMPDFDNLLKALSHRSTTSSAPSR